MAKKSVKKINDACRYNEGVQCLEWGRCETCGWRPGVEKMRKENRPAMRYELCRACEETLKEGYDLKRIGGGVDNKITCANCQRRRYGGIFELTKKEKPSEDTEE